MGFKMKMLGLGITSLFAAGALTVMSASATVGGHFTGGADHVMVTGTQTATHSLELTIGTAGIVCDQESYTGTVEDPDTTVTSVSTVPTFIGCKTTNGEANQLALDFNGCELVAKIGKKATATENTADIACPGQAIAITHPNCTIRIPGQGGLKGLGYHTIIENGKHAITATVDIRNITTHFEAGICIFLGTNQSSTFEGSLRVTGANTSGEPVDITATGSED